VCCKLYASFSVCLALKAEHLPLADPSKNGDNCPSKQKTNEQIQVHYGILIFDIKHDTLDVVRAWIKGDLWSIRLKLIKNQTNEHDEQLWLKNDIKKTKNLYSRKMKFFP